MSLASARVPQTAEEAVEPVRVHVAQFPYDYGRDPRSYLGLLWAALERHGVATVPVSRPTPGWAARETGVEAVHLHWLEFIVQSDARPVAGLVRTLARAARLIVTLVQLRRRRVAIVWTIHNLQPHEPVRPRVESALSAAVIRLCDAAIVHSGHARRRVADRFGFEHKLVVVPHGNYVGVFPDDPRPRRDIRRTWSLPPDAFVFLAFGQVRPYKRLVELVSAFSTLAGDDLRLVIAGNPATPSEAERLRAAAGEDDRVILDLRRIPDEQIAALHRAADAAVLAYEEVFSSGALLLAMSYELPVVAPAEGSAAELLPAPGLEPFKPGELPSALERMRRGDHAARARASAEAAARCSWDDVGRATAALYRQVARFGPPAAGGPGSDGDSRRAWRSDGGRE